MPRKKRRAVQLTEERAIKSAEELGQLSKVRSNLASIQFPKKFPFFEASAVCTCISSSRAQQWPSSNFCHKKNHSVSRKAIMDID
ncbi:hypothetical protein PoB_004049400 [Plakobranchus ocellatus]|uniref:Uncharacterized protein n=1 Tax=Plakobranchus ocellatus TaxID=259542 RepID=A0AAV4B5L3_9GAST|nr:hypothetical protein PoB_004049400 [Plakobranchus ocellatus]